MTVKTFQFSVYSLAPLPQEMRTGFKMPMHPFSNGQLGPLPPVTEKYFQDLQIVHYRDEIKPMGILCQPLDEDETPMYERSGFIAYKSCGILTWKGMDLYRWTPDADPDKYRKLVKRHGDDSAWTWWNQAFTIRLMTEREVHTS